MNTIREAMADNSPRASSDRFAGLDELAMSFFVLAIKSPNSAFSASAKGVDARAALANFGVRDSENPGGGSVPAGGGEFPLRFAQGAVAGPGQSNRRSGHEFGNHGA